MQQPHDPLLFYALCKCLFFEKFAQQTACCFLESVGRQILDCFLRNGSAYR